MQVVLVGNHLNQLQRHHGGQDHARNGNHDIFRKGLDHAEYTGVPALRRLPNLHGYISDLLVYRIEHPGQVAHNADYQHFLEPLSKRVQQKIHTV